MSVKLVAERGWWHSTPCRNCSDPAEVGEKYCPACLRDRELAAEFCGRDDAKHAASHAERGQQ